VSSTLLYHQRPIRNQVSYHLTLSISNQGLCSSRRMTAENLVFQITCLDLNFYNSRIFQKYEPSFHSWTGLRLPIQLAKYLWPLVCLLQKPSNVSFIVTIDSIGLLTRETSPIPAIHNTPQNYKYKLNSTPLLLLHLSTPSSFFLFYSAQLSSGKI